MKAIDSTKLAKMTEFLLTNIGDKFIRASSEKSVNYLINFYKTKGIEITDELVISVLTKAKSLADELVNDIFVKNVDEGIEENKEDYFISLITMKVRHLAFSVNALSGIIGRLQPSYEVGIMMMFIQECFIKNFQMDSLIDEVAKKINKEIEDRNRPIGEIINDLLTYLERGKIIKTYFKIEDLDKYEIILLSGNKVILYGENEELKTTDNDHEFLQHLNSLIDCLDLLKYATSKMEQYGIMYHALRQSQITAVSRIKFK